MGSDKAVLINMNNQSSCTLMIMKQKNKIDTKSATFYVFSTNSYINIFFYSTFSILLILYKKSLFFLDKDLWTPPL